MQKCVSDLSLVFAQIILTYLTSASTVDAGTVFAQLCLILVDQSAALARRSQSAENARATTRARQVCIASMIFFLFFLHSNELYFQRFQ